MRRITRIVLLASLGCCVLCGSADAQNQELAGEIQQLKTAQIELRNEMKLIHAELQALRQTLLELKQIQQAVGAQGEVLTMGGTSLSHLSQINKKLDRVIADLKVLKKSSGSKSGKRPPDTTVYDIKVGSSPTLGPPDAPVTIVEFVDFQCPFCAREWPKLQKILAEYAGQVRLVFKHYPLRMHKKAPAVHVASILAQQQLGNEGFWRMHNLIIENPKKIEIADLRQHAETLGLDLAKFDAVMADEAQIKALLADSLSEAMKCKVRSTPTIMINGLKMSKRNLDDYRTRIGELLKKKP